MSSLRMGASWKWAVGRLYAEGRGEGNCAVDSLLVASYNKNWKLRHQEIAASTTMTILPFLAIVGLLLKGGPDSLVLDYKEASYQSLFCQAGVYRTSGEFANSYECLKQAFDIASQDHESSRQGKCLIRMGVLIWNLGNIATAQQHFDDAAKAFEMAGDRRSREFCENCLKLIELYNLGREDRRNSFYYRSLDRLKKASLLARETGIPDLQLKCLRQEALTYLALSELEAFLENNLRGLAISRKIAHRLEQGRCLNNIGIYHHKKNNYSRAIIQYEEALMIIRTVDDRLTEAECLNNLGLVYSELGNLGRALDYISEAMELDKVSGNAGSVTMDLNNIGSLLLRRGIDENRASDLYDAFNAFKSCLSLLGSDAANDLIRFSALNNIGVILSELKDHDAARRQFEQAVRIIDSGRHELEKAIALANIGASYLDEKDVECAQGLFIQSYQIGARYSYDKILVDACFGLGQCYEIKREPAIALSYYLRAIEASEDIKARIVSESFMIGFARNKFGAYEKAIHILAGQYVKQPSSVALRQIFDLFERMKARAFLESIHEAQIDLDSEDVSLLKGRQQAISKNISDLTTKLADHSGDDDNSRVLKKELDLAEEDYARVVDQIRWSKGYSGDRWRNNISHIDNIQRLLHAEKAVLLEYFLDEERSYLISISSNDAELHVLPSKENIETSIRAYLKFISDQSLDPRRGFVAAERIGRELIPLDVSEKITRANALIVIPDGLLHYLPFEALRLRSDVGSRYIVEDRAVSYCPSASALFALMDVKDQALRPKDMLAIGCPDYRRPISRAAALTLNPLTREEPEAILNRMRLSSLPYSKKEVRDIASLFPQKKVDLIIGESANEQAIKNLPLTNYKIIHFACHGFVNEKHPFRSALALSMSASSEEDGLLQMREIYGVRIRADLVVLSACRTGKGRIEQSEGPMALARSFFIAGARSVMSSLWAINDQSTALFMCEFYRCLIGGNKASDAVRLAKNKLLRSRWAHPFFWAGYLLNGHPGVTIAVH